VVPEERQVSQRRCCCGGGGNCYCFCFEVTAKHAQQCALTCTVTPCTISEDECRSFTVTNTYTPGLAEVSSQQFVVATEPDAGTCDCYGESCVYTWTPSGTTFDRDVCFLADNASIAQTSTSGNISVAQTNAPACPGGCNICCGTNRYIYSISYVGYIPAATVSGACGDVTYVNVGTAPSGSAWQTTYTIDYCYAPNVDPCTMTLFRISGGGINALASYGPDQGTGADCDCGGTVGATCSWTATGSNCVPLSGDFATLYTLAGSPPMTLTCYKCECPE